MKKLQSKFLKVKKQFQYNYNQEKANFQTFQKNTQEQRLQYQQKAQKIYEQEKSKIDNKLNEKIDLKMKAMEFDDSILKQKENMRHMKNLGLEKIDQLFLNVSSNLTGKIGKQQQQEYQFQQEDQQKPSEKINRAMNKGVETVKKSGKQVLEANFTYDFNNLQNKNYNYQKYVKYLKKGLIGFFIWTISFSLIRSYIQAEEQYQIKISKNINNNSVQENQKLEQQQQSTQQIDEDEQQIQEQLLQQLQSLKEQRENIRIKKQHQ